MNRERPKTTTGRGRPMSAKKRWAFRILAMLLPVLALEAAARIYWVQFVEGPKSDTALYEEMLGTKVLGDDVPYQFRPNHEFLVAATPTKTNNLALRGNQDVDLAAEFAGVRVLCVGDSVTFGYTVSGNEATYPFVLQELLRDDQTEYQVLNGGMPRFRIQHVATMFADHFRHYRANYVVILGGWNNANDRVLRRAGGFSWIGLLNRHWYTLRAIRHLGLLPELGGRSHEPAVIDEAGYLDYAASLERLVGLIRQSGAQPVLCTLPHFFHNVADSESREKAATFTPVGTLEQLAVVADSMNQQILTVAERQDVPVIDLRSIDRSTLFGDAIHPNDAGSRRIAEFVAAFFRAREVARTATPGKSDK